MFKKIASLSALAATVLVAASAQAQTFNAFTPDNNGAEFWDNVSTDGDMCNVGYVVTGVAGTAKNPCNNQRPLNWLPYTGVPMAAFYSSPMFVISGGTLTINVASDIAGQDREWGFWTAVGGNLANKSFTNVNTLGSAPAQAGGNLAPMSLTNVNAVGSFPYNFSFANTDKWGFYVVTTDGITRTSDMDAQFALFRGANDQYVVGIEDTYAVGDSDYQDMIASVTFTGQVPEPTSFALVGVGLAAMVAVRRRRNA